MRCEILLTDNLVQRSEDFGYSTGNSPWRWQIFSLPASNDTAKGKCDPEWKSWRPDRGWTAKVAFQTSTLAISLLIMFLYYTNHKVSRLLQLFWGCPLTIPMRFRIKFLEIPWQCLSKRFRVLICRRRFIFIPKHLRVLFHVQCNHVYSPF